jgi:hypothetical protein
VQRLAANRTKDVNMWENLDQTNPYSAHYVVMRMESGFSGMQALRELFPEGIADELNMVLFSTSGCDGTRNTIEKAETHLQSPGKNTFSEVTFLVLHPRRTALRFGNCSPETQADIDYLKRLRATSHAALAKVGIGGVTE